MINETAGLSQPFMEIHDVVVLFIRMKSLMWLVVLINTVTIRYLSWLSKDLFVQLSLSQL